MPKFYRKDNHKESRRTEEKVKPGGKCQAGHKGWRDVAQLDNGGPFWGRNNPPQAQTLKQEGPWMLQEQGEDFDGLSVNAESNKSPGKERLKASSPGC